MSMPRDDSDLPVGSAEPCPGTGNRSAWRKGTADIRTDLRGRSVRSGFLQMGSRAAQLLLLMGSGAVMARLLTPQDFGLVAMVASLTAFVSSFNDFGLTMALVHREEIDERDLSALFWVTLKLNAVLALVMVLLAPLLAWFYGEARLTEIVLVLAISTSGLALATQHQSILIRQMRFGTVTLIEVGSLLAGLSLGIAAALLDAGYWALVCQLVGTDLSKSAALWATSKWRPGRYDSVVRARTPGVRSMLAYGSYLTGFRVINHIGLHLDRVLVGYFSGATAVGLYANSQRWSFYSVDQVYLPLRNVVVASLSRVQSEPAAYRAACRAAFVPIFSLVMPALAFMFVEARDVILLLLGDQWLAAVPLFRVMCVAGFASAVTRVIGWLYFSQGAVRRQFRWGLLYTPVMVMAVAAGVPWGPYGVAVGFTVGTYLLTYPTVAYCLKTSHLTMGDFLAIVARPTLASSGAAATLMASDAFFPAGTAPLFAVVLKLSVFLLLYLVLWISIPGGRHAMANVGQLVREVLPRRETRQTSSNID